MPARLNRRRYREVVAMLKEVIADKKATRMQRLRAGDTLLTIYDRHDRTEATREARKRTGANPALPTDQDSEAVADTIVTEDPEGAAARFLESMRRKGIDEQY